ncbi:MAG: NUDIX domain-containing protein [Candidatus Paceibacterota bacterium]|jgi:ADP-ribose pyrophosphatase YjhB (NUDIX family)
MDRRKHNGESIEDITRAIIIDKARERILFCSPKNKRYYYLPGGHIEFQETARKGLKRELLEETGIKTDETKFVFAGMNENLFVQKGIKRHEMNFFFVVDDPSFYADAIPSREDHIAFSWLPFSKISESAILPESEKKSCENIAKGNAFPLSNL